MKFKILPNRLRKQQNNIINKNERLATNIVKPEPSSIFDKSHRHLTTFDSSKLVPIFVDECLPGDIFNIDVSTLIRLSIPNAATMENPVYDISFFFVPNRILWDGWIYFMGENKSAGYQKDYKTIPIISYDYVIDNNVIPIKYNENDLASYLGIPINIDMSKIDVPINSLFFKAYGKIWNDYYRDENLQSEIDISNNNKPDNNVSLMEFILKAPTNGNSLERIDSLREQYNIGVQCGLGLAPVSRLADYFSTCLPYPQKGDSVSIDTLPLKNLQINLPNMALSNAFGDDASKYSNDFRLYDSNGDLLNGYNVTGEQYASLGVKDGIVATMGGQNYSPSAGTGNKQAKTKLYLPGSKLDNAITSTEPFNYTINDLRLSLAIQHMRELDARGGTRYIEMLYNHFGVQTSDSRLDRAEMIGGFRDNINISNVVQSAPGTGSSTSEQLGALGGVSVTGGRNPRTISYACKEHGIIMGFITVRPQINYSQGLEKKFTRIEKLDYYDPALANIGEQPVKKYELYLSDAQNDNTNNDVFGYNEAWADYRYSQNKLSGYISVNSEISLANLYTYTENYANAPVLGSQWMYPDKTIIGNTLLLVGSDTNKNTEFIHQFMGDFYFNSRVERKLPVYSIPGLKRI